MHLTVPVVPGSTAGFSVTLHTLRSTSSSLSVCCPVAVSSGGHPADVAVLHSNILRWIQALASSSPWSAFISRPKLQFAVCGAMTDSIFHPLAASSATPAHIAHPVLYGQPVLYGVRLPGWKTGSF